MGKPPSHSDLFLPFLQFFLVIPSLNWDYVFVRDLDFCETATSLEHKGIVLILSPEFLKVSSVIQTSMVGLIFIDDS